MEYSISFKKLTVVFFCIIPLTCYPQQWRVLERIQELKQNGVYVTANTNTFTYNPNSGRGSNYSNDTINYDEITATSGRKGYRTYSSQNQILSDTYFELSSGNVWKPFQADSFVYLNGRLIRHDEYKIVNFGGKDSLTLKKEYAYVYDNMGLLQTKTTTGYTGKVRPGPNVIWNYYSYNTMGLLIQDSTRINANGVWSDFGLSNIDYDTSGNIIIREVYRWDSTGKKSLASKTDYFYNSNGLPVLEMTYNYASTGGGYWFRKVSHAYNASGQRLADTITSDNPVLNTGLLVYRYTSFGYYSEVESGGIDGAGNVSFSSRMIYKYGHYWPNDIHSTVTDNNVVVIYPNPVYDKLYIGSEKNIEGGMVYNSTGVVISMLKGNTNEIATVNLPAGYYFLKLIIDGKTVHKPFFVMK